jgi:S1-C subfamily serine protease
MKKTTAIIIFLSGLLIGLYIHHLSFSSKLYAQAQVEEMKKLRNQLQNMEDPSKIYTAVTKIVSPSIVGLTAELEVMPQDFFSIFFGNESETVQVKGSGIIFDKNHIITNYHVVRPILENGYCTYSEARQAGTLVAHFSNEESIKVKVVGCDPSTDIAVLEKVDEKELVEPVLGDSDKIEVAQGILVIGNPFGLGISVSSGIISAKERKLKFYENEEFAAPLIQINASVNTGNSGGALVNLHGEIIGVVTAAVLSRDRSASSGIGFAIPINIVKEVVKRILSAKGKAKKGKPFIGIQFIEIKKSNLPLFAQIYKEYYRNIKQLLDDLGLSEEGGVFITEVVKNSPAWQAGLREGDVIIKIDDTKIDNSWTIQRILLNYSPGDKITLEIVRNKKVKTISLTLGKR